MKESSHTAARSVSGDDKILLFPERLFIVSTGYLDENGVDPQPQDQHVLGYRDI